MDYEQALREALAAVNAQAAQQQAAANIEAGNAAYGKLAEEVDTRRSIERQRLAKRMAEMGIAGPQSLTIQNNSMMAGYSDIGDISRQNKRYTGMQNAMKEQADLSAAAQAARITADMNAAEDASDLEDTNNRFEMYYRMYMAKKMTRSQFKKKTGMDVRGWAARRANKTPTTFEKNKAIIKAAKSTGLFDNWAGTNIEKLTPQQAQQMADYINKTYADMQKKYEHIGAPYPGAPVDDRFVSLGSNLTGRGYEDSRTSGGQIAPPTYIQPDLRQRGYEDSRTSGGQTAPSKPVIPKTPDHVEKNEPVTLYYPGTKSFGDHINRGDYANAEDYYKAIGERSLKYINNGDEDGFKEFLKENKIGPLTMNFAGKYIERQSGNQDHKAEIVADNSDNKMFKDIEEYYRFANLDLSGLSAQIADIKTKYDLSQYGGGPYPQDVLEWIKNNPDTYSSLLPPQEYEDQISALKADYADAAQIQYADMTDEELDALIGKETDEDIKAILENQKPSVKKANAEAWDRYVTDTALREIELSDHEEYAKYKDLFERIYGYEPSEQDMRDIAARAGDYDRLNDDLSWDERKDKFTEAIKTGDAQPRDKKYPFTMQIVLSCIAALNYEPRSSVEKLFDRGIFGRSMQFIYCPDGNRENPLYMSKEEKAKVRSEWEQYFESKTGMSVKEATGYEADSLSSDALLLLIGHDEFGDKVDAPQELSDLDREFIREAVQLKNSGLVDQYADAKENAKNYSPAGALLEQGATGIYEGVKSYGQSIGGTAKLLMAYVGELLGLADADEEIRKIKFNDLQNEDLQRYKDILLQSTEGYQPWHTDAKNAITAAGEFAFFVLAGKLLKTGSDAAKSKLYNSVAGTPAEQQAFFDSYRTNVGQYVKAGLDNPELRAMTSSALTAWRPSIDYAAAYQAASAIPPAQLIKIWNEFAETSDTQAAVNAILQYGETAEPVAAQTIDNVEGNMLQYKPENDPDFTKKVASLNRFTADNDINELFLSTEDILKTSAGRTDLAERLILATKEIVPGKRVPELYEYFKLPDNPGSGSLSSYQSRIWYLYQESLIKSRLDYSKPLDQVALDAFNMRNQIRTQTREAMSDRDWAEFLEEDDQNWTYAEFVEYKRNKTGLSGDALWQEIIESSMRSRAVIDMLFGLKK